MLTYTIHMRIGMPQSSSGDTGCLCTCADHWRRCTSHCGFRKQLWPLCLYLSSFLKGHSISSPCTSTVFSIASATGKAALDEATDGLLPVKCDAPLSGTILLSSLQCWVCPDPCKLKYSLLLWLHSLMNLSAFPRFLCVFICFLVPCPASDLRICAQ